MTGERKGIAVAGNILTDNVKTVNDYPKQGMLANILSVSRSVGGCVPNTAIDIAKIDRSVPLYALGKIGDDEHGRYVISKLQKYGIDTGKIAVSAKSTTSFSDVMSLPTGERTFFHARGANAEFSPDDIDLSSLSARMLHIGYILLLDSFDNADFEYGAVMARFLHDVKEATDFVNATGVDALAVAIGTAHGAYKAKPRLDIERLKEIHAAIPTLRVLHGGSGLSDDDFRNTVREGISKVNIFTDLCIAGANAMKDAENAGADYLKTREMRVKYINAAVKQKIKLFGSIGKY